MGAQGRGPATRYAVGLPGDELADIYIFELFDGETLEREDLQEYLLLTNESKLHSFAFETSTIGPVMGRSEDGLPGGRGAPRSTGPRRVSPQSPPVVCMGYSGSTGWTDAGTRSGQEER